MPNAIETVDVNVPVTVAYNQWTKFEEFPKFLSFVESIIQVNDTLTEWKVKIGGVEREFEAQVTEQHPDEKSKTCNFARSGDPIRFSRPFPLWAACREVASVCCAELVLVAFRSVRYLTVSAGHR